ncbi:MAG: LysM peptidoglycan-binding domain-containing protein [Chitinophagales bacterium]
MPEEQRRLNPQIVKAGDTLYSLARRFYRITVNAVASDVFATAFMTECLPGHWFGGRAALPGERVGGDPDLCRTRR